MTKLSEKYACRKQVPKNESNFCDNNLERYAWMYSKTIEISKKYLPASDVLTYVLIIFECQQLLSLTVVHRNGQQLNEKIADIALSK